VYGIKVRPTGDPYIETAEKALTAMAEAGTPGAFLVDSFPIRASLFIYIAHETQILLWQ
jgi:hypothetical protein